MTNPSKVGALLHEEWEHGKQDCAVTHWKIAVFFWVIGTLFGFFLGVGR